jgi:hypothetical protein
VDQVEARQIERRGQRVGADERKGEMRLRVKVYADDLEAGTCVPDRCATRPAE